MGAHPTRAFVFHPNRENLRTLGFEQVAHIPVLFHGSGEYARPFNHFLRARALGEWPNDTHDFLNYEPSYLRDLGLKCIADDLVNFLQYIENARVALDWRTVAFNPDILRYRERQLSGQWSALARTNRPHPLAEGTVARRVLNVTDALTFAAANGYRAEFRRPGTLNIRRFSNARTARPSLTVRRQSGLHVRQKPIDITASIPTKEEIADWLSVIQRKKGYTKALACKTALVLALRRNEDAMFPLYAIPKDRSQWRAVGDNLTIKLTDGTKGGKERSIIVPVSLAVELDAYRNGRRLKALKKWIERNPDEARPQRLFLGEHDGQPLSAKTIYEAFTVTRIFPGWSPHLARHTWACNTLLDQIRSSAKQLGIAEDQLPGAWIENTFASIMSTIIQSQLGHVSEKTTRAYLTWINLQILMPRIYDPWHNFLEIA